VRCDCERSVPAPHHHANYSVEGKIKNEIVAIFVGGMSLCSLQQPAAYASIVLVDDYSPTTYSGSGNWDVGAALRIGDTALGEMTIDAASTVSNTTAVLGTDSGARGTATVTGGGSRWVSSGDLIVGDAGTGVLTISNGGAVSDVIGYLGYDAGASGTATVTGAGSVWTNSSYLRVGRYGTGVVNILSGASVLNTTGYVGYLADSSGTMTVTGAGSEWTNSDSLRIGHSGTGVMTISDGGAVSNTFGALGYSTTGSRGTVTVSGAGSAWTNTSYLMVGRYGTGTVTISNGGMVSNTTGYLGYFADSGGTVTVTGADSTWSNSDDLYIGGGSGGTGGAGRLTISDGGVVTAQDASLWSSGTLAGNSILRLNSGSGILSCYGTLAPGSGLGTLTIDGDVRFEAGSNLQIEVDNGGHSDRLAVTGDVTINGGTISAISDETITRTQTYTILTADRITHEFTTLDTALLKLNAATNPDDDIHLAYEATSIELTITAMEYDDPTLVDTPVQRQVGRALQVIAENGGNAVTTELQTLDGPALRDGYDQLAGQHKPVAYDAANRAVKRLMGTVSARMRSVQGGTVSMPSNLGLNELCASPRQGTLVQDSDWPASFPARGDGWLMPAGRPWGVWGKAFAVRGDRETTAQASGYDQATAGLSVGMDYQLTPKILAGVLAGYSDTDLAIAGSRDTTAIRSRYVGVYGSYETFGWYLDSTVVYARNHYTGHRGIDIGGIHETAQSDYHGDQFAVNLEAGLNRYRGDLSIQPFMAFDYITETQAGYAETGSSSNLHVQSGRYESSCGSLGAALTKRVWAGSRHTTMLTSLRGRWSHEFENGSGSTTSRFAGYQDTFTVTHRGVSRDSFMIGGGVTMTLNKATEIYFDYDCTLNKDYTSHFLTAGFQYRW
jgi:T5SS/PEP-CTERM-associated repeat protein